MKLYEITKKRGSHTSEVTISFGDHDDVKLSVNYDYTAPSVSRHGDNSTFDERHPAEFDIQSIELAEDFPIYDDDGDKIVKTLKKGTNVKEVPGWKDSFESKVLDELEEIEPDDY